MSIAKEASMTDMALKQLKQLIRKLCKNSGKNQGKVKYSFPGNLPRMGGIKWPNY